MISVKKNYIVPNKDVGPNKDIGQLQTKILTKNSNQDIGKNMLFASPNFPPSMF